MFHAYKNGNYKVLIFDDGTKVRRTEEDDFIPDFSENCDVKITDKCSQGCPFCYEGCTKAGKHADLLGYNFLDSLHPYTELALNGNDLDHPELEAFLQFLKKKKVFANITVNQNQFMSNSDKLKELTDSKLIYGLGVSLVDSGSTRFFEKVKSFPNAVIHTIAGLLTGGDLNALSGNDLKVLILGYKTLGRGRNYYASNYIDVTTGITSLKQALPKAISEGWFKVLSFDNLAIQQLDIKSLLPKDKWEEFYMGDDGNYTFYIDMVSGTYAKNSISKERYPIGDLTVDEMFQNIRNNTNTQTL